MANDSQPTAAIGVCCSHLHSVDEIKAAKIIDECCKIKVNNFANRPFVGLVNNQRFLLFNWPNDIKLTLWWFVGVNILYVIIYIFYFIFYNDDRRPTTGNLQIMSQWNEMIIFVRLKCIVVAIIFTAFRCAIFSIYGSNWLMQAMFKANEDLSAQASLTIAIRNQYQMAVLCNYRHLMAALCSSSWLGLTRSGLFWTHKDLTGRPPTANYDLVDTVAIGNRRSVTGDMVDWLNNDGRLQARDL